MKAKELIEALRKDAAIPTVTCDTLKAGSDEREISRLAVSMFATVEVLREVKAWGADMLIVHEPTYYDHMDVRCADAVTKEKERLIEESGITLYRHHDGMHYRAVDLIAKGELHYIGLSGSLRKTPYAASSLYTLDEGISALALAERLEKELGISHVRIAGERNKISTKIAACFGTPSGVFDLLKSDEVEILLVGETCEWMVAEYARDAAALGKNKSVIVMGHIGSERDGMRYLTERLKEDYPSLSVRYFECQEVYTYTDS